jgi:large subunit ribosomal protein L3
MTAELVVKKLGMTRVFTQTGESIPVTVVEALPNYITQIKTEEKEHYSAVQVAAGAECSVKKLNKPLIGHLKKAGVTARKILKEFRLSPEELKNKKLGDALTVRLFKEGQRVDVQGVTKGKGFAGTVKRHNFRTQDASHGNSLSHRVPGSIGQCQTPGRVIKGKKMAGHMGNELKTIQNQSIVKVDVERNLLFIKGGVPGAPKGWVVIKKSVKVKSEG